jgi:hypothetical protein
MVSGWVELALVSATSVAASSGFWAYVQSRGQKKTAVDQLLMVIVYKELTTQGLRYIHRGWVSKDELEDYRKLLFEPYKALGGNGVAERIMHDVDQLPLRSYTMYSEVTEGDQR